MKWAYRIVLLLVEWGGKFAGAKRYSHKGEQVIQHIGPLVLFRQEGSDNPTTVLFARHRGRWTWCYTIDPGKMWHSVGKNKDVSAFIHIRGWKLAGVFLSHTHPDHWGNLSFFRKMLQRHGRVYAHPSGFWLLQNPNSFARVMEKLAREGNGHFRVNPIWRALYWIWPVYLRAVYGFIRALRGVGFEGGVLARVPIRPFRLDEHTVRVLHTPGHSPDGIALSVTSDELGTIGRSTERIIVTSDDVPPQDDLVRGSVVSAYVPDADVIAAVRSLEMLREHHATALIPSHGAPILGEEEVERVLTNLIERTSAIIVKLEELWRQNPEGNATQIGRAAFESCGIVLNQSIGIHEMTSYAVSIRRSLLTSRRLY